MSQENVEHTHRAVDALNGRDLEAYLMLMDEDVEAVSRIAAVEGGLHGHDGIRTPERGSESGAARIRTWDLRFWRPAFWTS